MSELKSEKKGGIKSKILCKYFIQGKCTKGDSCPYLHSKVEKPKDIIQPECPMYNIGFCKNGRNCHFLHIKKDKYTEEKIEDKNTETNNPIEEEKKIIVSDTLIKEENKDIIVNTSVKEEENKEENITNMEEEKREQYPEIPIWYLEHYFDKPIPLIFSELEQKNLPEIMELKKKYGFTNIQPNLPIFPILTKKSKMNLNMNTLNLNFNNFNMNFAFNNNKTEINSKANNNLIPSSFQGNILKIGPKTPDKKYDQYETKKNSIEILLNKSENIFYYLKKCKLFEEIKKSQETNSISLPQPIYEKYKNIDVQNMTIIIIIVDEEFQNFSGFAKLKTPITSDKKEEETLFKIEWLWRTKLSLSKVNHLMNKADNDNLLIEGKNGCEIDKDLGFFCCRYMMKRLTKEEITELTSEKKMFDSSKKLLQNLNSEKYNHGNSNNNSGINTHNNSNKDINYIDRKYENNDKNSPYKNSNKKSDLSNTNSTKFSEHKKHEKDYKDNKDQKYTSHKRHRDYSRSKSKSKNRRDHSEDYSNYNKNKNIKYQDKHYSNNYNNYYHKGSNNYNSNSSKMFLNHKNYTDYKENNHYQKYNSYNDNRNGHSNKKYYN